MFIDNNEFENYWKKWSEEEESNYKVIRNKSGQNKKTYLKKGYLHFDERFWFPDRKNELKEILKNNLRFYNKEHNQYEFWPFKPFLRIIAKTPRFKFETEEEIYKKSSKKRPICFASHLDALIFGFYSHLLTKKYETYIQENGFANCPIAYRSNLNGYCNIQFAKEVFDEIKLRGECTAIALDIKGYFDNISHSILKVKWCKVINETLPEDQFRLFKYLTNYSYVNKSSLLKKFKINKNKIKIPIRNLLQLIPGNKDVDKFKNIKKHNLIVQNKTSKGIPQGSGLSSVLSNIYLIDFDQQMNNKAQMENFLYRRYCDDIVIICNSDRAIDLQDYVMNIIKEEYKLDIQSKKIELIEFKKNSQGVIRSFNLKRMNSDSILITDITNEQKYYKPFQYLGFEFNGKSITIRSSSISKYFIKMKSRISKTLSMAYGSKGISDRIWREQMLHRYTHLGKRNFITYAYNAAKAHYKNKDKEVKPGLNSVAIKRQLARHMTVFQTALNSKNIQTYQSKISKGKDVNLKSI